ncbi:uncharacterized protein isoform X1 [Leptinotarsa decemlineata]|uniref:uncharacterized protein isoform X1 n=1 Tax=Leptinotarsa decemlineata TaxID=7539 RepID=UPI003D309D55
MNLNKFTIESFLFSSECEEYSYLFASSSSSDDSDEDTEKPRKKLKKINVFSKAVIDPLLNPDDFKNHFRVNRTTFVKVSEVIQSDFCMKGISPQKAALVLLWYLGNQEHFKKTSERFNITMSCVHNIIKIGTRNLSCRKSEYIKWPASCEYPSIARLFEESCDLKGVIGAIGVSHIKIPKPEKNSLLYISNNGFNSVVLQGVVTVNKKFIDFFISEESDVPEVVLNKSSLPLEVKNGLLGKYFLIGHQDHPKYSWLLHPFDNDNMRYKTGYYNIAEEAFNLLKGRFQHLQNIENGDVVLIKQLVEATCVLHNFCIDCEDEEENFFCHDSA